jgi:hypothetical protein
LFLHAFGQTIKMEFEPHSETPATGTIIPGRVAA